MNNLIPILIVLSLIVLAIPVWIISFIIIIFIWIFDPQKNMILRDRFLQVLGGPIYLIIYITKKIAKKFRKKPEIDYIVISDSTILKVESE